VRKVAPPAAAVAVAVLVVASFASPTGAQAPLTPPQPRSVPELIESPSRPGVLSQRPYHPLDGAQAQRLLHAQATRESGRIDAARDELVALLAEAPHHPIVLVELARTHLIREQWGALERLCRAERAATRDSVLLGRELAEALEQQSRLREAAQVAIEVWVAAPSEMEWCEGTIQRLGTRDSRGPRELLRKVAEARPLRLDLVRGAARMEWKHGDGPGALKLLAAADALAPSTPVRWSFAEELLYSGSGRDSTGAIEALLDLTADHGRDPVYRLPAARRAWQVYAQRGMSREGVLRVSRTLADLPPTAWPADLLVGIVRGLREGGYTAEVRTLLDQLGDRRSSYPELALEGALNELRAGPPARALAVLESAAKGSREGVFHYAEALFFAGLPDSAARLYQLVSVDPKSAYTGASLERLFLIEDADPRSALPALGRMAYEEWRGEQGRAAVLADSLYRSLPRGPLWAFAALELATHREQADDGPGALEPLLAVADSLPNDRLAPVACQRAGDVYRLRLKNDAQALARYEECLSRYPKAWNASEVRRAVETLRRERRF
jgi:tetratricopeptide (TPR) repeat protein